MKFILGKIHKSIGIFCHKYFTQIMLITGFTLISSCVIELDISIIIVKILTGLSSILLGAINWLNEL